MDRVGDDEAGYSIALDAPSRTVLVRAWGFWSAEVAGVFATRVIAACRAAPAGTALHMDMSALKPMREEGQRSFAELVGALDGLRVARTTVATTSHLTRLQLLRIATAQAAKAAIQFVEGRSGS